jgi:hypothetical protein
MVPLTAPLFGVIFTGAYLRQKSDLLPPLESERNSVQRHVSSYILNRIPVMAPILAPLLGVLFYGGISSSKIGPIAPS